MTLHVHWWLPPLAFIACGIGAVLGDRGRLDAFGWPGPSPQSFLGAGSIIAGVLLLIGGALAQLLH